MPTIYLSPSTQEANIYVTDGNSEEYYMNKIADAMEPYLRSSGIKYVRNTPQMTAASSIAQSNAGDYDAHIALHSNAAPEGRYGEVRGSEVYFYPYSNNSRRLADIIANNLKEIYPIPDRVRAVPTTFLGEVTRTRAPAVLIEFAYHDNVDDATWIQENITPIAENVVLSLTEFFGIPFITPQQVRIGTVNLSSGNLNIRSKPDINAPIIGKIPNGAKVTVYSQYDGWYVVGYENTVGYVASRYIVI